MQMAVGPAGNTNVPPQNYGGVPPKQEHVGEFKEALNRSTTSNDASGTQSSKGEHTSEHSQDTSKSLPFVLATRPPINLGSPTVKQGAPLYDTQGSGSTTAQQTAAPAQPGKPIDVAQMEALNRRVQSFNVASSRAARDPDVLKKLKQAQKDFQDATDALKAGDYKKAEGKLGALGFPLPGDNSISDPLAMSAILLGTPVRAQPDGSVQINGPINWGRNGNQALNDLNGFAANAKMINRLASAPGGVSNPPTEAQVTRYMRDLANPPTGPQPTAQQPTAQEVMQAASDITGGMIMHYSSVAGRSDPVYNANPNPHAAYKDRAGKIHEFPSMADAQNAANAARANRSPDAPATQPAPLIAHSPDEWSDVSSQGQRAGRYIGDCESKVYMQTRLLTSAGFTSLGSFDVQHDGGPGHMLGVFKAPDGTTWVTSNEDFRQVSPSDAKVGVTQADLDATVKQMTGEVYHTQDLRGFRFSSAATANLPSTGDPAVDSIRRSTELSVIRRTEVLIPPPPPPAQGQPGPATGSGGPEQP
jgi:hypothetical protein